MNPLFSIIVPIYNVSSYLTYCLDSILSQSYNNIEIILVDDGSFDGSSEICDKYAAKDKRINVIHKSNGGLVSARQVGLASSTGDYIINLDGDDWISNNYCEVMANIINKTEADIVMCGYYSGDENNSKPISIRYQSGLYDKEKIIKMIYPCLIEDEYGHGFPLSIWAKTIKASLQKSIQFSIDKSIIIGEDSACTIPCIVNADSIYICSECLYYYRFNPSSLTNNRKAYDLNGPLLRKCHLESSIDITSFDFYDQMNRAITHALFNAVKSQCYTLKSLLRNYSKIRATLSIREYKEVINNCNYRGLRPNLMRIILKYKLILPIYLYNYIRFKYE